MAGYPATGPLRPQIILAESDGPAAALLAPVAAGTVVGAAETFLAPGRCRRTTRKQNGHGDQQDPTPARTGHRQIPRFRVLSYDRCQPSPQDR